MPKRTKSGKRNAVISAMIAAIIMLVLALSYSIFYYTNKINTGYEKKPGREWLAENCKCVEYNGTAHCFEGFELVKGFCRNGSYITNRLISCSKYKCPDYFVEINESIKEK